MNKIFNKKHYYKEFVYGLLGLLIIVVCASLVYAQTVNVDPFGRAVPRLYDVPTYGLPAPGAYYLDVPTLTANDTLTGLTTTQTLTNKTMTAPTVTNPTVSTGKFTTPHMEDPNMGGVPKITGAIGTLKFAIYQKENMTEDETADAFPNAIDGIVFGMANPDTSADCAGIWMVGADGTVDEMLDIPSARCADSSSDGDLCLWKQGTGTVLGHRVDDTSDVVFFMIYN